MEAASERLNPILVKETRQALKGKQFAVGFLLLLAVCWVITIGGVAILGPAARYAASGGLMFIAYQSLLCVAVLIVAPFAAFRSLAAEQEDNTRDVLMISAMTPRQLINGKLGSAMLQVGVYVAALAPCLAFCYLLRGIDLFTLIFLPTVAVVESIGLSLLGLLLASVARQRFAQVLASVGLIAALILSCWLTIQFSFLQLGSAGLLRMGTGFWLGAGLLATFYTCGCLLIYFGAAALNSFASANRSTALRRVLLLTQVCIIGWAAGGWFGSGRDDQGLLPTALVAMAFFALSGMALVSERPISSERVRRTLPETPLARSLATWLNPGPGTGYFFVVSNTLAVVLLALLAYASSSPAGGFDLLAREEIAAMVLAAAYLVGLLGIGRLVIDALRRLAKLSVAGGYSVNLLLLLACFGVPELLRGNLNSYARLPYSRWDLCNPFRTLAAVLGQDLPPGETAIALLVVVGLASCVVMVNIAAAAHEVHLTRAPLPQRVIEDDAEQNPVEERVVNPWGDVATR